jgi:Tfp pilus assembly protein PilF
MKRGMLNLALTCFTKAIDLDPKYAEAWKNKGNVYSALRKFETALICLNTSLKIDPKDAEALTNKGAILAQKGDTENAKEVLLEAAKVSPNNPSVFVNLGLMQAKSGESSKAIESFEKALALDAGEPTALYNMALAHEQLLNHRQAWSYLTKYRDSDPEDSDAIVLQIKVAEALGYSREAERLRKEQEERRSKPAPTTPRIDEKPLDEPSAPPERDFD